MTDGNFDQDHLTFGEVDPFPGIRCDYTEWVRLVDAYLSQKAWAESWHRTSATLPVSHVSMCLETDVVGNMFTPGVECVKFMSIGSADLSSLVENMSDVSSPVKWPERAMGPL